MSAYPPPVPTSLTLSSSKSQPPLHSPLLSPTTTASSSFSLSARTSPLLTPIQSPTSSYPLSPLPTSSSSIDAWHSVLSSPALHLHIPAPSHLRTRALSDPDSLTRRERQFVLTALPSRPTHLQQWNVASLPSPVIALGRESTGERKLSAPSNFYSSDSSQQLPSQEDRLGEGMDGVQERKDEESDVESSAGDMEALPRSSSLLTSSLASLSLQKQHSHSARPAQHNDASSTATSHTSAFSDAHETASSSHQPRASLSSPPHTRSLRQFSHAHPQPHSRPLSSSALLDLLRLSHHHSHLPVHAYTPLPTVMSNLLSSPASSHARAAFLLTRSYFADPRTVTELLVDTLYTDPPVDLTHDRELGQTETRLVAAWRAEKMSALLMLQEWAEDYPEDLAGLTSELVEAMSGWPPSTWRVDVVDGLVSKAEQTTESVAQSVGVWEEHRAREQQEKVSPVSSPNPSPLIDHPLSPSFIPVPIMSIPLSSSAALYNYSSMLIAQQMTLLTLDRLSAIRPRHLLSKHRTSLPAQLNQMKLSNSVTLFIASHVVTASTSPSSTSTSSSPSRVAIFRKWIKVASILFQLGNWNSVFEVMYGLTHHAVWRLRLADELQSEERDNYSKLCLLVSSDDNYACYRRVKASKKRGDGRGGGSAGCLSIPYLGVVLKDLVAMEESQIVLRIGGSSVRPQKKLEAMDITTAHTGHVGSTTRGERSAPSSLSGPYSSDFFSSTSGSSGLSVPSFAASTASMSSMDSLSSVHSVTSTDGGASVDSVESDLFGDDSSGSLTLPSLLSASLLKHSSLPLSAIPHDQSPSSCPSSAPTSLHPHLAPSTSPAQSSHPPQPSPVLSPASSDMPAGPLSASSGVLLNWGKLQHIHALVTDTLTLPSAPYFPPLSDLQQLLVEGQQSALSERQLMEASLVALPRKGRESVDPVRGGTHSRAGSSSSVLSGYGARNGGSGEGAGEFAALGSSTVSPGRVAARAMRGSSSSSVLSSLKQQQASA